jgi:phosphoribosylaminoimidazolecarboxamide formyltransferase/IMP cyclohydrolase
MPQKVRITEIYPDGSERTRELVATMLRYGENWDQRGSVLEPAERQQCELRGRKAVSFNNEGDMNRVFALVERMDKYLPQMQLDHEEGTQIAGIVKHQQACGASITGDQTTAYVNAKNGDLEAAFGGIMATNSMLTRKTVQEILDSGHFLECIIAPGFETGALEMFPKGKSVRLVDYTPEWTDQRSHIYDELEYRSLVGGRMLVQDFDSQTWAGDQPWRVVTTRQPTGPEIVNCIMAWIIAQSLTSNAVTYVKDRMLRGSTAGQQKRSDSAWFSGLRAQKMGLDIDGASAATDGFWPFPDGIGELHKFGITAVMCPGGEKNRGKNEQEIIDTANELGIAMLHTDKRVFKH